MDTKEIKTRKSQDLAETVEWMLREEIREHGISPAAIDLIYLAAVFAGHSPPSPSSKTIFPRQK